MMRVFLSHILHTYQWKIDIENLLCVGPNSKAINIYISKVEGTSK